MLEYMRMTPGPSRVVFKWLSTFHFKLKLSRKNAYHLKFDTDSDSVELLYADVNCKYIY